MGINTNNPGTNSLFVRGRTQIDGDLQVTGNILGNLSISNATFSSLTVSTVASSNGAIALQPGGTTGLTLTPQTNDPVYNLFGRNIIGGYASNAVGANIVGATIAGGGALDGTNNYRNLVTGSFGTVSGGLNNSAGPFAVVTGGEGNKATNEYSAVLGGFYNLATGIQSTVAGGGGNEANGNYSFAAGRRAIARHDGAFVWADNQGTNFFPSTGTNQFLIRATGGVGINTNAPGNNALLVNGAARVTGNLQVNGIIVSGTNNSTTGTGSVTGGGVNNTNSGIRSTIAGGSGNAIYFSAVGGAVGGGTANLITNNATNGTISGGEGNTLGGNYAFIGGGYDNGATGEASTVSGGEANVASGAHATVSGGLSNSATGVGSFAAGVRAKATNDYSFVWGGSPDVDTVSTNPMSYTARAPGGFRLMTSTNSVAGLVLPANSSTWASLSDSNAKTDIRPVDCRKILAKLAKLPVTGWRYKHDPARRYIGPMAQDFHATFALGSDDKTISTLDTDGVTLAAIKGLVEEIDDQDRALDAREAQINRLEESIRQVREQLKVPGSQRSF